MTSTDLRRPVGVRAAVFTCASASLAVMGHLSATPGAAHLDIGAVVGGGGAIGLAVAGLCRRQRSFGSILLVLLASQVAFHLLFLTAGHASALAAPAGSALPMLLAHAAMALATALVLTGADTATARLAAAARRIRAAVTFHVAPIAPSRSPAVHLSPARLDSRFLTVHSGRGPPCVG